MEENIFTVEYIIENGLDKLAYGFIYITENNFNEMEYIGQRKFIKGWQYYLGSGVNFKKDLKQYGRKNFSRKIIAIAYSEKEINDLEIKFIKNNNAVGSKNYYNIADGGHLNPMAGKSKEEINKIHKKRCMEIICLNDETIYSGAVEANKILGIPISSITTCCKGKRNSAGLMDDSVPRAWMYVKDYNENIAKEILQKAINSKLPSPKKIILVNTSEIFNSATEASNKFGINRGDISACCRGKKNYAGIMCDGDPYLWEFYTDKTYTQEEIQERIHKCKNLQKGYNHPLAKKVKCINTNEIFNYLVEASKKYNIGNSSISACCRGETKYSGKHPETGEKLRWAYEDEYLKSNPQFPTAI